MARKIKIAFDVVSTWDYESFRQTMKELVLDDDKYEVSIVTSATGDYVTEIAGELGVDSYQVDEDAIVYTLDDNKIDIYLTPDIDIMESVSLLTESTIGVLVNPAIQDSYSINPKWSTQMQFWISRIRKDRGEQESC